MCYAKLQCLYTTNCKCKNNCIYYYQLICHVALEFLDWQSVDLVTKHTELTNPLGRSPFYVLIETAGSNNRHDEEVSCICL